MPVRNVARNMKCSYKPGRYDPHDKKAGEVYLVHIFRIEKEIWNAEVFSKISGNHRKQNDPAEHQHMVASNVVEQQLNRERIEYVGC